VVALNGLFFTNKQQKINGDVVFGGLFDKL
jgi:hypothetical protein